MSDTTFRYEGTVSEGTLRPEDLKPKFFEVANAIAPIDLTPVILGWRDDDWDLQVQVAELIDFLDEHAPEGYHFGTHEGDGACFGFWKEEENGDEG